MPGPSLRAPLLWLLVPFMAGIALADARPEPIRWIPALAMIAAGLGGLSCWLAKHRRADASVEGGTRPPDGLAAFEIPETRPEAEFHLAAKGTEDDSTSHTLSLLPSVRWDGWSWATALIAAGLLSGYVALPVRSPRLAEALAAPREIVVTLEAEQVFPPSPARKTLGGLGRIVATDGHLTELVGQRVYFSAIKRISLPPARSGCYQVRGVLQALVVTPEAESAAGFQRYLESAGIRLTLTRAQIVREVRPPGWFRRFCTRTEDRLEAILRQGIERHPGETSLYLGMLLGEKAALSADQQNVFMRSGTFHILRFIGIPLLFPCESWSYDRTSFTAETSATSSGPLEQYP